MGLKLSDLHKPVGIEARALREVNAIYMENREEFETTTITNSAGVVRYVHGKPPEPWIELPESVTYHEGQGLGKRPDLPEWKIRQNSEAGGERREVLELLTLKA